MISREEAKYEIEEWTDFSRMTVDAIDAQSVIDKVYDSRGECGECIYMAKIGSNITTCSHLKTVIHKGWYCGDFIGKDK